MGRDHPRPGPRGAAGADLVADHRRAPQPAGEPDRRRGRDAGYRSAAVGSNTARVVERQCRDMLDGRLSQVGVAGQIRSRLQHDQRSFPSMQTIADELHLDPRTLRRKLSDGEHPSASSSHGPVAPGPNKLLAANVPIETIARQLGYAETAKFHLGAFTRWTGMAPSVFRRSVWSQSSRSRTTASARSRPRSVRIRRSSARVSSPSSTARCARCVPESVSDGRQTVAQPDAEKHLLDDAGPGAAGFRNRLPRNALRQ